ncbi:MAG: hypothetical protein ACT4P8_10935 [Betaproteobacteria bacterium]
MSQMVAGSIPAPPREATGESVTAIASPGGFDNQTVDAVTVRLDFFTVEKTSTARAADAFNSQASSPDE